MPEKKLRLPLISIEPSAMKVRLLPVARVYRRAAEDIDRDVAGLRAGVAGCAGGHRDLGAGRERGADGVPADRRAVGDRGEVGTNAGSRRRRRIGHGDVVRVEQPRASASGRRRGVHARRPRIEPAARGLDEAAVAAIRSAARAQATVGARCLVAPQHDPSAVAGLRRIGRDARPGREVNRPRIRHVGSLPCRPPPTSTSPPPLRARRIDAGPVEQTHFIAQQPDLAALSTCAGGARLARPRERQPLRRLQHDLAARTARERVGPHDAALVDGARMHVDAAARRQEAAEVDHLARTAVHLDADVGCGRVDQLDARAGRQQDPAARCVDLALVPHGRTDQRDLAAEAAAQLALVDDRRRRTRTLGEAEVAGEPVGVVEVERGGHQPGDVDARTLAEQHAVRVEQPDAAIAAEAAEDGRGVVAGDAVEDLAGGTRLLEAHRIGSADREGVPVDDRVGGVVHREGAAHGARRDLAGDGVHATRQDLGAQIGRAGPEAQQRARGQGMHQTARRRSRRRSGGTPTERTGVTARGTVHHRRIVGSNDIFVLARQPHPDSAHCLWPLGSMGAIDRR